MGCEPFAPWFDYAADDPGFQFIGRADFSTPEGPTFAFPNGTVRFRCECTGVDVFFDSQALGDEAHTNFITVLVDGVQAARVQLPRGGHVTRGARDLAPGEHLIELVKSTEAYAGQVRFLGVSLQGSLLPPPPRQRKRFEFVGDSITCGYGNRVRIDAPTYTEPNTGYHALNQDITQAYGPLTGRALDAEVVTTCFSGRGVYRSNDGSQDTVLPFLYDRTDPERALPRWDPSRYVPDVLVINLGTNDFSVSDETGLPSPPDAALFEQAYGVFVRKLRALYPSALIVCAVGPMLNDVYPKGRQLWTLQQRYVSEVVSTLNANGDHAVLYFAFTPIQRDPYGEDWHPTAQVHRQMADELTAFLRGWGF